VVLAAAIVPSVRAEASMRQTNMDIIAGALERQAAPGDFIVVNPWYVGATFWFYYHGMAKWATLPPIAESGVVRFDLLRAQLSDPGSLQQLFEAMEKSLSSGGRLWIVGPLDAPAAGQLPPPLPTLQESTPDFGFVDNYQRVLTLHFGYFVQSHTTAALKVDLKIPQPVSPYEKLDLAVFKGWRP
jgi:hypothetical protein